MPARRPRRTSPQELRRPNSHSLGGRGGPEAADRSSLLEVVRVDSLHVVCASGGHTHLEVDHELSEALALDQDPLRVDVLDVADGRLSRVGSYPTISPLPEPPPRALTRAHGLRTADSA